MTKMDQGCGGLPQRQKLRHVLFGHPNNHLAQEQISGRVPCANIDDLFQTRFLSRNRIHGIGVQAHYHLRVFVQNFTGAAVNIQRLLDSKGVKLE